MAIEIVMPRLGWTMEEGVLAEWLKHDGDIIQPGDLLFTVESDKALNEVEAFDAGILHIPPDAPAPGTTIPVGGRLAYLLEPGEAPPEAVLAVASSPILTADPSRARDQESSGLDVPPSEAEGHRVKASRISPRARRIAAELNIAWETLAGSGRTGRIIERDIRAAAQQAAAQLAPTRAIRATPLAKRVADDLGVDLTHLAGQIPDRRIERADVEHAARSSISVPDIAPQADTSETRTPLTQMRRVTAERMAHSAHTAAPVTLTTEVDVTELVRLRKQIKADSGGRSVPSYTDLLVKLCAEALREHPALNARLDGDSILHPDGVHIGIAVDSERGLLVPVLRDAGSKSVRQIAHASAALIEQARAGKLNSGAMQGGTFTITNLGMFEIDAFTPIINLPECAILGVGRIVAKQVVIDADTEQVAIRQMMFLSLTFDHRLVDGATAARFLQRVRQFIAQPYLWLV